MKTCGSSPIGLITDGKNCSWTEQKKVLKFCSCWSLKAGALASSLQQVEPEDVYLTCSNTNYLRNVFFFHFFFFRLEFVEAVKSVLVFMLSLIHRQQGSYMRHTPEAHTAHCLPLPQLLEMQYLLVAKVIFVKMYLFH